MSFQGQKHNFIKADWSNDCMLCDDSKYKGNHFMDGPKKIPPHTFEPAELNPVYCSRCSAMKSSVSHTRPKVPGTNFTLDPNEAPITLKATGDCCGYLPRQTWSQLSQHDRHEQITEAISMPNNPQDDSRESGTDSSPVNKVTLDTDFIAKVIAEEMAKLKAKNDSRVEVGSEDPLLANEEPTFVDLVDELTSARDIIAEASFPDEYEDVTMEEGIREHFPATIANLRKQQELGHTNTVIIPEGKMSETEFILNGRPFKVTNWGSQQGMHHATKVTIELEAI